MQAPQDGAKHIAQQSPFPAKSPVPSDYALLSHFICIAVFASKAKFIFS